MSAVNVPMPVDRLHGLGVVVDDLDRTIDEYGAFFGIDTWQVRRFSTKSGNLTIEAGGKAVDAELLWATGQTSNLRFDLVKPVSGDTIFSEFLGRRGAGVQSLWTHSMTPAEFEAKLPLLARDSIGVLEAYRFGNGATMHFLDSVGQLGTIISTMTANSGSADEFNALPVERTVTVAVPPLEERLPIDRPYHVCVLTRNRRLSVRESFERILGVADWFEYDNEAGVTSAGASYYGRLIDGGRFRLALGRREKFAVEVVEMMFGDNVYQDMLDTRWEGVHHLMSTIAEHERLEQAVAALASQGYSVVQDGKAGQIYYGYLAAEGRIADLAVEILSTGPDDPAIGFGEQPWAILRGPDF